MTQKIALITGVTGQDGAYLSEYLLKKGYIVIKALDSVVVVFQGIRYFPSGMGHGGNMCDSDLPGKTFVDTIL